MTSSRDMTFMRTAWTSSSSERSNTASSISTPEGSKMMSTSMSPSQAL